MKNKVVMFLLAMLTCLSLPDTPTAAQVSAGEGAFHDGTVILNDLRLHYLEWPNEGAAAMLLLPGTGGGGGSGRYWASFANSVRARYRVLALEPRGCGESEWAKQYSWQLVVSDVDAFIDHFHLAPVVLVGHSSGAIWAYLYAATHPEKVSRLVAVDSGLGAASVTGAAPVPKEVTFGSPDEAVDFAKSRWHTDPSVDAVVRDWIAHGLRRLDSGRWTWRLDPAGWQAPFPNNDELKRHLRDIRCPTLVVHGAESYYSRDQAELTAATIPNGGLVEVPHTGHVVHLANPSGFLAVVSEFLGINSKRN